MTKVQNISSIGDLRVPLLGREIAAGEIVAIDDALAEQLLAQPDNFRLIPWSDWTVDELTEELVRLGLDTAGKKAELIGRLEEDRISKLVIEEPSSDEPGAEQPAGTDDAGTTTTPKE